MNDGNEGGGVRGVAGLRIALAAGALAGVVACGGESGSGAPRSAGAPAGASGLYAEPFPLEPIAMTDLDGVDRSSAGWGPRITLINVWATWCGPCRREMPFLQEIHGKYGDRVQVIGLLQDQASDAFAREFIRLTKVTYPVVRSTVQIESALPAVLALPMTYVIDGRQRLVAAYAGELEPAVLESDLRTILARATSADR